jgi:hypothetical protein
MRQASQKQTEEHQDEPLLPTKQILVTVLAVVAIVILMWLLLETSGDVWALLAPDNCDSIEECIRQLGPRCPWC